MPAPLTLPAHAKLNLFLEVTDKRPDGFHNLQSVFIAIDFADQLTAKPLKGNSLKLECTAPNLPLDDTNLALRAARLLQCHCGTRNQGLHLRLAKSIPPGSGLGGGSSDAATALRLANTLWNCGLDPDELAALGATIGSDIPFFLHGGAALVEGRGERVTPLPDFPNKIELGLALPPLASNTALAYRNIALPEPGRAMTAEPFIEAMAAADVDAMEKTAFNRFEPSVFTAFPELGAWHGELATRLDRPVRLSGSGSALWFFAPTGWREDGDLQTWADNAGIRLLPARAVPAERTGDTPQP